MGGLCGSVEDQPEVCLSLLLSLSARSSNTKTIALELEVSSVATLTKLRTSVAVVAAVYGKPLHTFRCALLRLRLYCIAPGSNSNHSLVRLGLHADKSQCFLALLCFPRAFVSEYL